MKNQLTPNDKAVEEYKRRERHHDIIIFGLIGAVIGAIFGFYLWMTWGVRFRIFRHYDVMNSWLSLILIVSFTSITFGALATLLRYRFDPIEFIKNLP